MTYQKLVIVGNLGNDPELRYTPQGDPVASFSVATNRRWTGRDGQPAEETTWFRVQAWGKQAEPCNQYLHRGSKVLVEGTLVPDKNTGGPQTWLSNDGTVRSSFTVRAQTVRFMGDSHGGHSADRDDDNGGDPPRSSEPISEDEIPF